MAKNTNFYIKKKVTTRNFYTCISMYKVSYNELTITNTFVLFNTFIYFFFFFNNFYIPVLLLIYFKLNYVFLLLKKLTITNYSKSNQIKIAILFICFLEIFWCQIGF